MTGHPSNRRKPRLSWRRPWQPLERDRRSRQSDMTVLEAAETPFHAQAGSRAKAMTLSSLTLESGGKSVGKVDSKGRAVWKRTVVM